MPPTISTEYRTNIVRTMRAYLAANIRLWLVAVAIAVARDHVFDGV
jgi:hypothetical protein